MRFRDTARARDDQLAEEDTLRSVHGLILFSTAFYVFLTKGMTVGTGSPYFLHFGMHYRK